MSSRRSTRSKRSSKSSHSGSSTTTGPPTRNSDKVLRSIIENRKRQALDDAEGSEIIQPRIKKAKTDFPGYPGLPVLGYNESYAGLIDIPDITYPPRQRWIKPSKPIHHRKDVPEGWNDEEPDLDPDDIEAQIARCHERITEGILPAIFEHKLITLNSQKISQDALKAKWPGHSWDVVRRLNALEDMEKWLVDRNDDCKLLPNVKAISVAYESGELQWIRGLVTYWYNGRCIAKPRPYNPKELLELAQRNGGGQTGFWVEGLNGPGPQKRKALVHTSRNIHGSRRDTNTTCIKVAVRLPGAPSWAFHEFDMLYDTGADNMMVYYGDFVLLQNLEENHTGKPPAPLPVCAGIEHSQLGDGSLVNFYVRMVEVNILADRNGGIMTHSDTGGWDLIQCITRDGYQTSTYDDRISGLWPSFKLFTGSAPDLSKKVYFTDVKEGLRQSLPEVKPESLSRYLPMYRLQYCPNTLPQEVPANYGAWGTGLQAPLTLSTATGPGVPVMGDSTDENTDRWKRILEKSFPTLSGQTTSGQTTSGQTTSGQTTSGQTTSGQTTSGQTTSGQTTSEQTTSGFAGYWEALGNWFTSI